MTIDDMPSPPVDNDPLDPSDLIKNRSEILLLYRRMDAPILRVGE